MKKGIGVLFVIVLLAFSGCRSNRAAEEAVLPLTEAQIREALDFGAKKNSQLTGRWTWVTGKVGETQP